MTPCVHWWIFDDEVCRCDGTEHYHATCWCCGETKPMPRVWPTEFDGRTTAAVYAKRGGRAKAHAKAWYEA
jgi:hypothetical protein